MSVRVRCRCGQELHLRHGEWVYVLLGLVVLCLALNSLAVLLVYLHLERLAEGGTQTTALLPAATDDDRSSEPDRTGPEASATGREPGSERVPAQRKRKETSPLRTRATSPSGTDLSPDSDSGPEENVRTAAGPPSESEVTPADDRGAGPPSESEATPADDTTLRAGRVSGSTVAPPRGFSGVTSRTAVDVPRDQLPAPDEAPAPAVQEGLFPDEPPLVRLLLLEEIPGGLDWRLSFLLDDDRRLRRRAFEKLRSYAARASATREMFQSRRARQLLSVVRDSLDSRADGPALLAELAVLFPGAREDAGQGDRNVPLLDLVSASARSGEVFLEEPAVSSMRAFARSVAERGLDCVLLVDVSQSMERVLSHAWREVARLWPILRWGLPGIRLGIALYRDEVVAVLEFSMKAEDQLARLAEVEATGGGDVPEGLHLAIKEALSLGVFDWREDAAKHLIVLGDAPPPYAEQQGLASIVRRARQQDGFRVHTLGVHPEEGRESVPFFVELAGAGGGRARTVDPKRIASELTLCLVEEGSAEIVEPLLTVAERLLSR